MLPSLRHSWNVFLTRWFRVSPLQGLLEAWLLAALILGSASQLSGQLTAFSLSNIIFFSSFAAGLWLALRTRLVKNQGWRKILVKETLIGLLQGALASIGILLFFSALHRLELFNKSTINLFGAALTLTCSGLAFYAARAAVWLLAFWNRLRKRSLMWSLTNAHLTVVLVGALSAAILFTIIIYNTGNVSEMYAELPPETQLISRLITTILPAFGVFTVLTMIALAVILPPSALFSFVFARRTTRRLHSLIDAAQHLRAGVYTARVNVEGEDEVAQLQKDFNGMAETLEKTLNELETERDRVGSLLSSRRELVASVSHELRTPVATLRGYLDSILENGEEDTPPRLREDLETMHQETLRLQALIDDLFTLSRVDVHNLPLHLQSVALEPLIRGQAAAASPLAWKTSRVEIVTEIENHLPAVLADPLRLEQILANLLRNAIRFTSPGGILAIIAQQEQGRIRIDVHDTGPGISTTDLPHIWERFFTGQEAGKSAEQSAGIGLALVKELTEAMGGEVGVESHPGEGSCFSIWLKVSITATLLRQSREISSTTKE